MTQAARRLAGKLDALDIISFTVGPTQFIPKILRMAEQMALLLGERTPLWQSRDGLVGAGRMRLSGHEVYYSHLGPRALQLFDVQELIRGFESMTESLPLLLLSECPGFEPSLQAEEAGLVFVAGRLRALQEERKQAGLRLISVAHEVAVGGVYLMHGLSASFRAVTPGTQFYDTIPERPPVPLPQVLGRKLIDAIVPETVLSAWIRACLEK